MSDVPELGRLYPVPLRSIWATEPKHFTPWLAKAENLKILSDLLRLGDLEVEDVEVPVGDFRIDILARDREDRIIVIENQLEKTDHIHLGQIMTYIGGQDGKVTAIWIADIVREEHRAAIDWLNANTLEGFDFFAVKIEVVKIGPSAPAPLFSIVSKPNSWSRSVVRTAQNAAANKAVTDEQKDYRGYWSRFLAFLEDRKAPYKPTSIPTGDWCGFGHIARKCSLVVQASLTQPKRMVEIYFGNDDAVSVYELLLEDREEIDREFPSELNWRPSGRTRHIEVNRPDVAERSEIDQFEWFLTQMQRLTAFFTDKIRSLPDTSLPGQVPI